MDLEIADTLLPSASVAGGSSGTSSWGSAIVAAAQQFRADHGDSPDPGLVTTASAADDTTSDAHAMHSFGAVFAEARVHRLTGEVRVPRLHGTYSVGRVINPRTARSQLLGGLVMGLSAALLEESWRDPRFGHFVTQDLATYHVATHADVLDLQAEWLEEDDQLATPMGSRGIGEIGIVGTSAAVAQRRAARRRRAGASDPRHSRPAGRGAAGVLTRSAIAPERRPTNRSSGPRRPAATYAAPIASSTSTCQWNDAGSSGGHSASVRSTTCSA